MLVEGHNLHRQQPEGIEILGFYTTRCVEAFDSFDAEVVALESVELELVELELKESVTDNSAEERLVVHVLKVEEVDSFAGLPNRGFTFFLEGS